MRRSHMARGRPGRVGEDTRQVARPEVATEERVFWNGGDGVQIAEEVVVVNRNRSRGRRREGSKGRRLWALMTSALSLELEDGSGNGVWIGLGGSSVRRGWVVAVGRRAEARGGGG